MAGGGAERLASDAKPRRLAGGAGEAAAADRARSGQSWGAELGGGGAELTQRAKLSYKDIPTLRVWVGHSLATRPFGDFDPCGVSHLWLETWRHPR